MKSPASFFALVCSVLFSFLASCGLDESNRGVEIPSGDDIYDTTSIQVGIHDSGKADLISFDLTSTHIARYDNYPKDSLGIYQFELNGKMVYYPITITHAANVFLKEFKASGSEDAKRQFLNLSRWLAENFRDHGDHGFWVCEDTVPGYQLQPNWPSAMAQGFGLDAMLGAYQVTGDTMYLNISRKALKGFSVPIEKGGFLRQIAGGNWYEEYPSKTPSMVLNGFIFSLCGLYNYYEATGDTLARDFFLAGERTFSSIINRYDAVFTSRYNLFDSNMQLANAIGSGEGDHYHHLHIHQLIWLYVVTKREVYYHYAHKFLGQDLGSYEKNFSVSPKMATVRADACIDCEKYGPDNLYDGRWSYGKYWSFKYLGSLWVDLGRNRENISQLVLYSTQELNTAFRVIVSKGCNASPEVFNIGLDGVGKGRFKTGDHETFIYIFPFQTPFEAQEVLLTMIADDLGAIREIDLQYDRKDDLEKIIERLAY